MGRHVRASVVVREVEGMAAHVRGRARAVEHVRVRVAACRRALLEAPRAEHAWTARAPKAEAVRKVILHGKGALAARALEGQRVRHSGARARSVDQGGGAVRCCEGKLGRRSGRFGTLRQEALRVEARPLGEALVAVPLLTAREAKVLSAGALDVVAAVRLFDQHVAARAELRVPTACPRDEPNLWRIRSRKRRTL